MSATKVGGGAGQKAGRVPRRFLPDTEVIGPPDCPILHRWTIFGDRGPVKLLLHRFLPNADDRDAHDHPRPFLTLVLRGGYDDLALCPSPHAPYPRSACTRCLGGDTPDGFVLRDRMRPGSIRYRSAEHTHRTRVHSTGCWTLVLMGPVRRRWGFWREGRWWPWREYERVFGFGMRCPDSEPDR